MWKVSGGTRTGGGQAGESLAPNPQSLAPNPPFFLCVLRVLRGGFPDIMPTTILPGSHGRKKMNRRKVLKILAAAPLLPSLMQAEATQTIVLTVPGGRV